MASSRQAFLDRARQGDGQALGSLLGELRPYIRVMVRALRRGRFAGRVDDSDLVQDALLEAHRAFADFRGTSVAELMAWLRTIVRRTVHQSLDVHWGAQKRGPGREEGVGSAMAQVADSTTSPSGHAIRREEAARMAELVARLPEDMQQVLLGRHLDGLSHAELAQRLGRTEAAARVLYVRALRRLRELCQ